MTNKEDLRVIRTRKLLYDGLRELMEKESIEKLSVVDICAKAMVHRTTFYSYYEDKYNLLMCLIEDTKEEIFRGMDDLLKNHPLDDICVMASARMYDYVENNRVNLAKLLKNNHNEKVVSIFRYLIEQNIKVLLYTYKNKLEYAMPVELLASFYTGGFANLFLCIIDKPTLIKNKEDLTNCVRQLISSQIYKKRDGVQWKKG